MADWSPDLSQRDKPRYLAIADAIAADIAGGRLAAGDRLPPQRQLAARLDVDFTTVARGYVEAQKRGLIESRVGQGTFVTAHTRRPRPAPSRRPELVDLSMNLPPEPEDPELLDRMQEGFDAVGRDLVALLRYQGFGGSREAKDAASNWLSRRALVPSNERLFVTPGAHPALLGILCTLARPGDTILSEAITYPGIRSLAAQIGLTLIGIPEDEEGIDVAALCELCQRHKPKALYLNPTFNNPTTRTVTERRRIEIVAAARRCGLPIIEDDAYGFVPTHGPAPFAAIAPDLTWHVAGLAKCIGAGLRVAYVIVPDTRSGFPFSAALRSATVMASPLTVALATRWIEDGTADALLRFIRTETRARQKLATELLPPGSFMADPLSFHLWVPLPAPWTRSAFVGHMRSTRIGVVASDAFTVGDTPPEAVRVCLGGPAGREEIRSALDFMAHALEESPEMMSTFL
ncbi:PLP-dependent aminotransferase family protein [Methylobrevis pamukkalensis]|uniref:Putative HTH-type transcriptional regulator YjiR n=1 Tax=Methylobrevis pamukkalensis TaxID=1439726 RepID=A0A1E3H0V6_9HYPH|nr:PLP-dependent aminotransferase family protein [Methylobrevis pamukkalensis]ODN69968.1 putative HTH-type transcriptional regulator YjiR [Methylobrevis pamukkalensis]